MAAWNNAGDAQCHGMQRRGCTSRHTTTHLRRRYQITNKLAQGLVSLHVSRVGALDKQAQASSQGEAHFVTGGVLVQLGDAGKQR